MKKINSKGKCPTTPDLVQMHLRNLFFLQVQEVLFRKELHICYDYNFVSKYFAHSSYSINLTVFHKLLNSLIVLSDILRKSSNHAKESSMH